MVKKGKPRGVVGREPTGIRPGELLSDYKRLTVRLPDDVRAELEAAGYVLGRQQWRVLVDAIKAYVGSGPGLSEADQQAVRKALRSRSGRTREAS